jgi:hypothetical protein
MFKQLYLCAFFIILIANGVIPVRAAGTGDWMPDLARINYHHQRWWYEWVTLEGSVIGHS